MTCPRPYVFVFWGENFDETPAAIFVSELRQAGMQVKVVGLNMQRLTGAHGLSLVPDMTLEQALPLAHRARCVIIPCSARHLAQFSYDPRLAEFFHRIEQKNRNIVIRREGPDELDALHTIVSVDATIIDYSDNEELMEFTRRIPKMLLL